MRALRSILVVVFGPLLLISLSCSSLIRSGTASHGTAKPKEAAPPPAARAARQEPPQDPNAETIRIRTMADAHRVAEYLKRNAIGRIVSLRGPFFSHEKVVLIRVDGAMATVKGALSNFKQNLEDVTTVVIY